MILVNKQYITVERYLEKALSFALQVIVYKSANRSINSNKPPQLTLQTVLKTRDKIHRTVKTMKCCGSIVRRRWPLCSFRLACVYRDKKKKKKPLEFWNKYSKYPNSH